MAKRKRLTPAQPGYLDQGTPGGPAPMGAPFGTTAPAAPIAQVAGAAATQAALDELAGEMQAARRQGRMIVEVPLDAVVSDYLVRDRIVLDETELGALSESLRTRGQQTPVELVALDGDGAGARYGLISGARRITALRRLLDETGDARFATVQALLRQPSEASEAYVAMVEENEIRVGLSYYERARIALRAATGGVYPDRLSALRGLFSSASRAKRSKIGSFMVLVDQLDGHLRFPAALGERAGLTLSRALSDDPGLAKRLQDALAAATPDTAEAEQALLITTATPPKTGTKPPQNAAEPVGKDLIPGVRMAASARGLVLSGPGVDAAFRARLETWLRGQT